MVVVKLRETYDLHTVKNKMTIIGIHTPMPALLKKSYPGLLMQCRAYRPLRCSVRIACASRLPLDPRGVGLTTDDVSPEDIFNPILYKAMSNFGMSNLEKRILLMDQNNIGGADVRGNTAVVDNDSATSASDEFAHYYGLLSEHGWKHANPQSGLRMDNLRPLVYEYLVNIGDQDDSGKLGGDGSLYGPAPDGAPTSIAGAIQSIRSRPKPLPFINTTGYSHNLTSTPAQKSGFVGAPDNSNVEIPYVKCFVGAIIVPPSRLHELFYRMVVEWDVQLSSIRPISEVADFPGGLAFIGNGTHYQNYSYQSTKKAVLGEDVPDTMDNDASMVSANVDIEKVM